MIERHFSRLACLLFWAVGVVHFNAYGKDDLAIPSGLARLTIERSENQPTASHDALVALNGRSIGNLPQGSQLRLDLAPGQWRVSVRAHRTAEPSILIVTLHENSQVKVEVGVSTFRLSPKGSFDALTRLVRDSLDQKYDERPPVFTLRQLTGRLEEADADK